MTATHFRNLRVGRKLSVLLPPGSIAAAAQSGSLSHTGAGAAARFVREGAVCSCLQRNQGPIRSDSHSLLRPLVLSVRRS